MCLWSSPIHYYILLGYFYWKKNLDSIFTCTNLHIWKTIYLHILNTSQNKKGIKNFFNPTQQLFCSEESLNIIVVGTNGSEVLTNVSYRKD